ncbi:AmmeMemoRadiSam system protein A [Patescibacteria group bacterium]|nr:AmmeMemoRadiSam system protein A [Patescibacteria group bacterium]MBU4580675.1 AmmeMemoRadiSam system protein A [Patescibacteria group bacterium]
MDEYTRLAQKTTEEYIKNGKIIKILEGLPEEFYSRKSGVFVTIFKSDELRGCVGTYLPAKKNIGQEIIDNAISACSRDHRFLPIDKSDLPYLKYEVSILSSPQLVEDIKKHNPKRHGLIVRCADGRCGLLLPDLDKIDTIDEQFQIACQKGGINLEKDGPILYFFTVEKHA